jgi:uncharacterized protein (DUF2141 family)
MSVFNYDIGFLARGAQPVRRDAVRVIANETTHIDNFKFTTGTITENVAISTSGISISPFSLALFRDVNNNGILDNGDATGRIGLSDKRSGIDEPVESLNVKLTQGTYFAQTRVFPSRDFTYNFRASRAKTGDANPLTSPEIQLGTIDKDLQRRDKISDKDTADNFAFTLDGNSSLDINVLELGNKKGDVNVRVVQDLDSDGFVDKNEVVVKGTSTLKGNVDTISGLTGAGDYILQVCQTSGNTGFGVNFNHSVA